MAKYKCKNCGYSGSKMVFSFTDYTYCIATNDKEEPLYIDKYPEWIKEHCVGGFPGEADIGEPVGCPKCHAWGVNNF